MTTINSALSIFRVYIFPVLIVLVAMVFVPQFGHQQSDVETDEEKRTLKVERVFST